MPGLQVDDGDGGLARCFACGALAMGPCASCRRPVCADCCVLTEHGTRTWAICHGCERAGGRSLAGGWLTVLAWIALPLVLLILLTALLLWIRAS